eukprot:Nitzschia sp. Nitz4//scaffold5_size260463//185128//191136//NITZ4_001006-RA/size260463-snap-gene-0.51-mRNA-1//-1//CDS//3329555412//1661//frame0
MSQPEWMLKFQQIGQKGRESVTVVEEGGIQTSGTDSSAVLNLEHKGPRPSSTPEWLKNKLHKAPPKEEPKADSKEDDQGDDDAAALFAAAASQPAKVAAEEADDDAAALFAAAASQPAKVESDDDAAALFAAAGSQPAKVEADDDAAALFAAAGSQPAKVEADDGDDAAALFAAAGSQAAKVAVETVDEDGNTVEEEIIEEEEVVEEVVEEVDESVVEESVVEESVVDESVVEESATSGVASTTQAGNQQGSSSSRTGESATAASGATPESNPQKMTDEEFGEPWVPNREQFIREVSTTQFEEVEVDRDTGNVHYEEVYLDENGNEVVLKKGDGDFLVDENGNEIEVDDYIEEEVPPSNRELDSTPALAPVQPEEPIQEREMPQFVEEVVTEPPYDPAYDLENQVKLLQRGTKAYRSKMSPLIPLVGCLAFVAGGLLFLFFVILADDAGLDPKDVPTQAPTPKNYLPLDPTNTGAIDVAATTTMASVTGSCSFRNVDQPHVIDQCSCDGEISVVADDVSERWASLKSSFMPSVLADFDEDITSCSASNQALVWLSSGVNNGGEAEDYVRHERYGLAYFYLDQNGNDWTTNSMWLSQLDVCMWSGVTCSSQGKVAELDVEDNGLSGQLSGALEVMENIVSLSFADNDLEGTIPSGIFAMSKLESLDISSNAFNGDIPDFPEESQLTTISFQNNNLSGKIPSTIGNLQSLTFANFTNNALTGEVPGELFGVLLSELYLGSNSLSSSIPSDIGDAIDLSILYLGPNSFTGSIPTAISDLTNLTMLYIEDVPELSGRLPASYGLGLTNLQQFVMTGTNVNGNIPDQFGGMTSLEVLDFRQNALQRELPTTLGLLTSLVSLNLQENAFTGTLPSQLGSATSLVEIKLTLNELTGTIPTTFGNLVNLVSLEVDGNFMSGRAPDEVWPGAGQKDFKALTMSHLITAMNDPESNTPLAETSMVEDPPSSVAEDERVVAASSDDEIVIESDDEHQIFEEGEEIEEEEEEVIEEDEIYYEEEEYDEEVIIEEVVEEDGTAGPGTTEESLASGTETQKSASVTETEEQEVHEEVHEEIHEEIQEEIHEETHEEIVDEIDEEIVDEPADQAEATGSIYDPFSDETNATDNNVVVDPENKDNVQFVPAQVEQDPEVGTTDRVLISPQKETSSFMYWVICILVLLLLGAGAYVGWYLVVESTSREPNLGDEYTFAPTPAPTIGLATAFDPVQGNCNFKDLENPHVIDQCLCVGEIQIIADDIQERYQYHLENFIPDLYAAFDDDISSCSARNQALVWVSSANDVQFTHEERVERFALATVYAAMGGSEWSKTTNWLSQANICSWVGVFCSASDTAQTLVFTSNGLTGTMPGEVALLGGLLQLFASGNEIEGPIPEALFLVSQLQQVDLSFNSLTGPVPPSVGDAKFLWELDLEGNSLSGRLSNDLRGAERLEIVNLADNNLVGSVPSALFANWVSLRELDLGGNTLTGTVPSEISNLQNLTSLTLGPNGFNGDVPTAIGALRTLEYLSIENVPLMAGRLPAGYGRNLTNLVELTITSTAMEGNIETDFGRLTNLVVLDLSSNQLKGTLPTQVGNLVNLISLDLSHNYLEGELPGELGSLTALTELSLNDNLFTNSVPNELGDLTALEELYLDGTVLTGRVPSEVCSLRLSGSLTQFIVDCLEEEDGVESGVICDVPDCCTSCR